MQLHSQRDYIKEIKGLLPPEAFAPAHSKLLTITLYLINIFLIYYTFQLVQHAAFYIGLSLLLAHCLSSIGFLAHDLSHRAIIRSRRYRYPLEVLLFGIPLTHSCSALIAAK